MSQSPPLTGAPDTLPSVPGRAMLARPVFVRWFSDLGLDDLAEVGGKNASLGELARAVGPATGDVRVPAGFAVTAAAYRHVLDAHGAWAPLRALMQDVDVRQVEDLARRARQARQIVLEAPLPEELVAQITAAHERLKAEHGADVALAVRSSATAEDLPGASFAGQHESFLGVQGLQGLLQAVRRCHASLFLERAIAYRLAQGFDHFKVSMSVGVMAMVRADAACSGVAFSLDTETGFRETVFITAAWGLGEPVVQGTVDPDEFHVFKPALRSGHRTVLRRRLGGKESRMVCSAPGEQPPTRTEPVPSADRSRFCLDDGAVLKLAEATMRIEEHYSRRAGHAQPMDIEWAQDGPGGALVILQARPETASSRQSPTHIESFRLGPHGPLQVQGRAVGTRAAAGTARVIAGPDDLAAFRPGEVLVAASTLPDWGVVMGRAAAIVTDHGGRTCHAAIVARELGVPAVVGCGRATALLRTGQPVTVSCAEGAVGRVYDGRADIEVVRTAQGVLPRPRTRVMVNLGNPDQALQASFLPCDGVGLARMEFIIAEHIQAHPMALVHPERIDDPGVVEQLKHLCRNDPDPAAYFVRELSEGIGFIAAAFHPRPVVVRLSDFKTNEYAGLLGGRWFEPVEPNPMLGFRGAARYTHPAYAEGFALECAALRRVREAMGLDNLRIMVPFCRRVDEARRVLEALARHGLVQGRDGLKIDVMCEIPNNVVQIEAFARLFDGFSIGSNDLTQLVLGVDRDSEWLAAEFDEQDPGVQALIAQAVAGAHRAGRPIGLCGQAPSDHPEVVAFLVGLGIDSISVTPDALLPVIGQVLAAEAALRTGPAAAL
jgi:pyruvate,water dikinase